MKKKRVIVFLSVVILTFSLLAGCGGQTEEPVSGTDGQEQYKIVMAHSAAENVSMHQGFLKFKEVVEKNSEGRMVVEIYPNAQLGADRELIEGVQMGNITVMTSSTAPQVNFVPAAAVFDLPFAFADKVSARQVFDGPFKDIIGQEYEKAGFKLAGFVDQGFRVLTLNKEARTPEDLKGVKIRTMENPYHMALWQAFGANPTPIPFNEVYTALQQGTVDGQENPYELIYSQKFYEQQDYIINTNHIFQTIAIIVNKQFYDSLPSDLKEIFDSAMQEAIQFSREYQDSKEQEYLEIMQGEGVKVIDLTPTELDAFKEKVTGVWDMIRKDVGNEIVDSMLKGI